MLYKVCLDLAMGTFIDVDFPALRIMWKQKYSHRDISPGNIIMYNGRARLSDLEFTASYGTIPREDIRIVRIHNNTTMPQCLCLHDTGNI